MVVRLVNLKKLKHLKFIDPGKKNDWDFGSYGRVAKKYSSRIIFFMNSHSYPICENWLLKLAKYLATHVKIFS